MHGPPGQVPEHPGVDGAEGEVVVGGHASFCEQPLQLGRREVGVEDEPRLLAHERQVTGVLQLLAAIGRAPVLPDDRSMSRPP